MGDSLRFPWAGDISQSINPWDFWIKSMSSQLGFINVKNVMSADSRIEQEIIEDVASYGRQLGQITDVMKVIIKQHSMEDLKPGEKQVVSRFEEMVSKIERVKKKWKTPERLLTELDTILTQISELKDDSRDIYEAAVDRIKKALQALDLENDIKIKSVTAQKPYPQKAQPQSRYNAGLDLSESADKAIVVTSQSTKKDID